ncbi:hypothetical protein DKX38_003481 [Salix brachista]|uniref:Uncharacterized protein n=1 Tax=Salix brachista TaxID=2182728 RepID=A0A5N5NRR9_9ROSI|nr:hypothetical protein DKX38_003481 [Salix brachista]
MVQSSLLLSLTKHFQTVINPDQKNRKEENASSSGSSLFVLADARLIGVECGGHHLRAAVLDTVQKPHRHSRESEVRSGALSIVSMPGVPGPVQRQDLEGDNLPWIL